MAKTLVDTCDPCEEIGIEGMPAERSVYLAIDGPPKRYELCTIHLHQLKPWWELYQSRGVDESLKPKTRRRPEPEEPVVVRAEPDPQQLEMPGEAEGDDKTLYVICPLPHKRKNSARVQFRFRASHATDVHDGAKVWDIDWQDPAGVLKVPCEAHAECVKANLSFPTNMSRAAHIRSCPLERIDQED